MADYSQTEILNLLLPVLKSDAKPYRKKKNVYAKRLTREEAVATYTADGLETTNEGHQGDYVVRNQTNAQEQYVLTPEKFEDRYQWIGHAEDGFEEYQAVGQIIAVELSAEHCAALGLAEEWTFEAAWGGDMVAKTGDYLAAPMHLKEVYRIARQEFFETYEPLEGE